MVREPSSKIPIEIFLRRSLTLRSVPRGYSASCKGSKAESISLKNSTFSACRQWVFESGSGPNAYGHSVSLALLTAFVLATQTGGPGAAARVKELEATTHAQPDAAHWRALSDAYVAGGLYAKASNA